MLPDCSQPEAGHTSLLVDIVKKEEDLRARKIAVALLGELGTEAGDLLKKELVLGSNPAEQLRILEVIDTVTRDLKTELIFAIESENSEIREAAFRLAERLNTPQIVELLLNYAEAQISDWPLTRLRVWEVKPQGIIEPIASLWKYQGYEIDDGLLPGSRTDRRACRGGTSAQHLEGERFLLPPSAEKSSDPCHRRFCPGTNSHPRVAEMLSPFVDDPDARVREIARGRAYGSKPIPTKE